MSLFTLGIDPGITGAIAFFPSHAPASVFDMPAVAERVDAWALHALLSQQVVEVCGVAQEVHCFVEHAQAMPRDGVTSSFHYGVSYGILLGVLAVLVIPYTEVRPGQWKRALGLQGKDKEAARLRAMQVFPHVDLHLKRHHGRAEALLLGWWGRQQTVPAKDPTRCVV
jgi:crossover junction endodeoxyribonuclease RuvC